MTYCDFQVGDQVVCVSADDQWGLYPCPLVEGQVYTVLAIIPEPAVDGAPFGVDVGVPSRASRGGWRPSRFRKVQRRKTDLSIEAFLTIKPGFEEPRRAPAPKKERVS